MLLNPALSMNDCDPHDAVDAEVFSPSDLLRRCMGKMDFAQRVLQRFLGKLPMELQALEDARQAGDVTCVAQIAHRLKGAAANIAAHRLRSLAAELEAVGRQQRMQAMDGLMQRLRAEAQLFARVAEQWRVDTPTASFTN